MNIFINTTFQQVPYDENMKIEDAYTYLKTLDLFKDSEDDNQVQ